MEQELCLILPTLNERGNIVPQIREVLDAMPRIGRILVVDDDSTDGTLEVAAAAFADERARGRLMLHRRTGNPSLSASLRDGVALSTEPYVAVMDCDLAMPAALIPAMLEEIRAGADIVVGSRFLPAGAMKRIGFASPDSRAQKWLSAALNRGLRSVLRFPVSDFTSGFVVARRPLFELVDWGEGHGEYFIRFMLAANRAKAKIVEVPYECRARIHGQSKTWGGPRAAWRNSVRYLRAGMKALVR